MPACPPRARSTLPKPKRVTVVGAGAAGLTAAIAAARAGARLTLLNAHPRIGLKILMSGGTRCNVTHREVTERDYEGGSPAFVRRVLAAFPSERTREWFESMGVTLKLEETGKYFPVTDDANTVLEALLREAASSGVELQSGSRVVRLERGQPWRLGIQSVKSATVFGRGAVSPHGAERWPLPHAEPDRWLEADGVVIATGGLSFPRTGSDGAGYALVQSLGHTLEPPIPALTPLTSEDSLCLAAQGVTVEVELSLWVDGRRAEKARGSMVITHFGYSGPAALDLSRHWLRAAGERRVTACFAPGETRESFTKNWLEAAPGTTVRRHLGPWLPERLARRFCDEAGVDPATRLDQVARERRSVLAERVLERDLGVTGTLGYEKAEVTAGGVRLSEVDPSTLESRVAPGLNLCGEILDVDGRLGGFNFQFAWSSGTVAGRSAAAT